LPYQEHIFFVGVVIKDKYIFGTGLGYVHDFGLSSERFPVYAKISNSIIGFNWGAIFEYDKGSFGAGFQTGVSFDLLPWLFCYLLEIEEYGRFPYASK